MQAAWYILNRDRLIKQSAKWYAANRERKLASAKKWHAENIERCRENARAYRLSNKDKFKGYAKKQRILNPKGCRAAVKRYKDKHPELGGISAKKYRDRHPLAARARTHVGNAIRRLSKTCPKQQHTIKYLGCTWPEYKTYIEGRFRDGMTWGLLKSGAIHIDHIRPISWFNLTNESERMAAFHFSNTQPMWAEENMAKGNRWVG